MFRTILIFLSLLTIPLRANLGETVQQCVVRYGKPIKYTEADPTKTPFGTITFAAGGYALTVFVINNMEVGARVFKIDKSAFTPSEMQSIMGADTAGSQWTSVPSSDPACLQWDRGDKATVLYDKDKRMLIFTSEAMAQALHSMPDKPEVDSSTNAATTNAATPTPVSTNAVPSPSSTGN